MNYYDEIAIFIVAGPASVRCSALNTACEHERTCLAERVGRDWSEKKSYFEIEFTVLSSC